MSPKNKKKLEIIRSKLDKLDNRLLSLMHTNDMRHNDLHNGNIMIGNVAGDEERVWIIDHNGNSPKQHDKAHTVNDIVFESY